MAFYSAMKNEILLFEGKWIILEDVILSEVSQVQKPDYHTWTIGMIYIQAIL
jgi:hypothetical protein